MKKKFDSLVIIAISFFILLILTLIPSFNKTKTLDAEHKFYRNFHTITTSISKGYKLESNTKLSNNIINLVYKNNDTNDYVTYFIDSSTGNVVSYKALIKPKFLDEFNKVEEKLLKEKYPLFIVNGIYQDQTIRYVEVKDNELVIHYSNVITNPLYHDPIYLTINNNEVSKYLNYDFELDKEYKNESAFDFDPTKKYIAFSFDDGPSTVNTKDIVDFLNNNKMHATFFMLGSLMNRYPDLVKYVNDNGMEIGSHTYSHSNLKRLKEDKLNEEIYNTDGVYNSIVPDKTITLLRPPYGAINDKIKDNYNYSFILWSVDTLDWKYKDSDYLFNYVINNVNDGDIVLMHDIHLTTKQAVENILPELYVRGYRVVSVSELAKIKNIELSPNTIYRSIK
jgi:peptidoglycan/xylan/chitin deacetylase (PgdA/CDA1 family)